MRRKCFMCGEVKSLTRHHVIPKSFGGTEVDDYKITLCEDCHKFVHFKIDKLINPTFEDVLSSFIKIKVKKTTEEKLKGGKK